MPECVIGFVRRARWREECIGSDDPPPLAPHAPQFPDVGATHFLNKLPGRLGLCAALTGLRLRGRELRDVGLATHYVDSSALPALTTRLAGLPLSAARDSRAVANALGEYQSLSLMEPPAEDSVMRSLPLIDAWFGGDSVEEIDAALASAGRGGTRASRALAASLLKELRRGAPTSLKVGFEAMRRHRTLTLRECLQAEFRLVVRFMAPGADFYEGVRSVLVAKDGNPRWQPASLGEVTPEAVASFFEPLPPAWPELDLDALLVMPPAKPHSRL
jgi:enoyl-CoA hydratase/carnithine racemase